MGGAVMTAPNMFPFLRYRNARKAIEWLGNVFGFEVHSLMDAEDGTVAHAELRFGPGIIMVGEARDDALGVKSPLEREYTARDLEGHLWSFGTYQPVVPD